jgi:hypothetical protein
VPLVGWALAPAPASAGLRSARAIWWPSPSAGIVGYRVLVREAGGDVRPPIDVGLAPMFAGAMFHTVGELDAARDYVFAVTGYLADGTETPPSNEVLLEARAAEPASCDAAIALPAEGGTFTGVTSGAGTERGSCAPTAFAPEQVFRWTPAVSGTATFQTCDANGTTFDTVLYVRGDDCTGPELACVDDAPSCTVSAYAQQGGQGSRVRLPVVAGQTYFIVVDGYGGGSGTFTLTVTPPAAEEVCTATVVPAEGGSFTGVTSGSSALAASCAPTTAAAPEQVFAWTPDASGTATIETCNLVSTRFDTTLHVRGGSCDGPELACNDDAAGCFASAYAVPGHEGSRVRLDVVTGTTYFIAVDGYGGTRGSFTLRIVPPAGAASAAADDSGSVEAAVIEPLAATGASLPKACASPACENALTQALSTCHDDGTLCDTGDPCDAGICAGGVCVPGTAAARRPELAVTKLVLRPAGSWTRVVARASFPASSALAPTETGALLDLRTADGALLYRVDLPPTAFRANPTGTRFRCVGARAGRPGSPERRLRRLTFRRAGAQVRLRLEASLPAPPVRTGLMRVGLGVRLGGDCAHEAGLRCTAVGRVLDCTPASPR